MQAVEVIGGSIRVPIFQKTLREGLTRASLDMHMNGDEAVALGSAFRAANVSTAFKPRFVGMTDRTAFSVGVELYRTVMEGEGEEVVEEKEKEKEEEGEGEESDLEAPVKDVESEKRKHGRKEPMGSMKRRSKRMDCDY